jgi:putative hemolysin
MLSNHPQADSSATQLLARVADFPRQAARFAATAKARSRNPRRRQRIEGVHLPNLLAELRAHLRVNAIDHQRIPTSGPVVVVANCPNNSLGITILTALLTRVRPDLKILTSVLLSDVPEIAHHCIVARPARPDRIAGARQQALHEALLWLQEDGMLVLCAPHCTPNWKPRAGLSGFPDWNNAALRLIRRTPASVLPIYFPNHLRLQFLSMVHPNRTATSLLRQFLRQERKGIEVRVGSKITPEAIAVIPNDRDATEYLRWRTSLLSRRRKPDPPWPLTWRSRLASKMQEPVAGAADPEHVSEELAHLPADRCLAQSGDLAVYLASAREIPHLLQEVGRLREVTFRHVGEGTGKHRDLDRFDEYYWHLLLWNEAARELVGAYRAGSTAEILPQYGVRGLYTSTLFRYDKAFFRTLGPALELGRSFVRPEYQRQHAPLLLLWRGIACLVAMRPEIPVLFGAVSISNDYNQSSRELICRYFESRTRDDELAAGIVPRRPFHPRLLGRCCYRGLSQILRNLEDLSQPITDLEVDGKGLPILLRQYAKIGGRLLAFNVDGKFSNVLDGLVLVDLRRTQASVLDRYMGRDAASRFRQVHGIAG